MATSVDTSPVYTTRAVGSVREADGNHFPSLGWICKMGSTVGAMAVADRKLCVRGVGGLRVADASVMPKVLGGHTEIPVKMLNTIERPQINAVGGVREI
jgi:hypothetical protein